MQAFENTKDLVLVLRGDSDPIIANGKSAPVGFVLASDVDDRCCSASILD